LERAKDPTRLVFEDLPEACGAGSFLEDATPDEDRVRRYVSSLQEALRELGGTYEALINGIQERLARAFRLRAADADGRRHELATRSRTLLPVATDLRLKSFLVRASDEILDTRAWTESVAALLARQPPAQWGDEDRTRFRVTLQDIARIFDNLEPLALELEAAESEDEATGRTGHNDNGPDMVDREPGGDKRPAGDVAEAHDALTTPSASQPQQRVRRVRLLVKTLHEDEQDGVIHVHPEDDELISDLHETLARALEGHDVHVDAKLAALGRLATDLLRARLSSESLAAERPNEGA
jgi:hypothetical protein